MRLAMRGTLLFFCSLSFAAPRTVQSPEPLQVVIVATTDVHGRMEAREHAGGQSAPASISQGGLDVLAGYLKNLRDATDGRVVLVDAGDIFQGTLASNLDEGEALVRAYNALGYAAAAIGNHEFDYGPAGPVSVARSPKEDPFGALKQNVARAKFPFLAANIREKATGQRPPWARPFTLVSTGGVKIGIIGLITPDTPNTTFPVNVASLTFMDPIVATIESAVQLRARGTDAIVVVAHLGGACGDLSDPRDLGSCRVGQESFRLAEALPAGIVDAILGGHTHARVRHFVNGIAVAQAAPYGTEFAAVDLWIDPTRRRVVADRTLIRPHTMICETVFAGTESCDPADARGGSAVLARRMFEGRPVVRDEKVAQVIAPFLRRVADKRAERLGITLAAPFLRNSKSEAALGNLVADALRDSVAGADFALMNPAGLRADLRGPELTYGELFEALPFDNLLATLRVTGGELGDLVRAAFDAGHILQVSGFKVVIEGKRGGPRASGSSDGSITLTRSDGTPLSLDATYTVVLNDFLAAGGDGLAPVTSKLSPARTRVFYERMPFRDEIIPVLRARARGGPLKPSLEGRIVVRQ